MKLLDCFISISETAAKIARGIRSDPELLSKLIEEKLDHGKNERFTQDFKTLSDVLIQEITRFELSRRFPDLSTRIYGEESSTITVGSEETTITILVTEDRGATEVILRQALSGDEKAASSLVKFIYEHESQDSPSRSGWAGGSRESELCIEDVGIWIDPIDGTNVYVSKDFEANGLDVETFEVAKLGPQNVTVLIGAFSISTGLPICGVIHQPFGEREIDGKWSSRLYYGATASDGVLIRSGNILPKENEFTDHILRIVTSGAEPLLEAMTKDHSKSVEVFTAAGAGYKMLCVVRGLVDLYVSSTSSTYYYDTCAPHAVLRAIGGGMVSFGKLQQRREAFLIGSDEEKLSIINDCEIRYEEKRENIDYSNADGLIAYRHEHALGQFLKLNLR